MASKIPTIPVLNRGMKAGLTVKTGRYIFKTPEIGEVIEIPILGIDENTPESERAAKIKHAKIMFEQLEDLNMGALTMDVTALPITEIVKPKPDANALLKEIEELKRQLAEKELEDGSHSATADAGVATARDGALGGLRGSRRGNNHVGNQT